MRSGKLRKVSALFLVTVVASTIGAVTFARASCAFTLTAVPAARTDRGVGVAPDSSVDLQAKCLHDAFNNPVPNATLEFRVTLPGAGSDVLVGTNTTDSLGNSTFSLTDANAALAPTGLDTYGTWNAVAKYNAVVSATTTFNVSAGVATGSMTGSLPAGSHSAGVALPLTASGILDSNGKPVNNGTVVSFSIIGPGGFAKTLTGPSTGVVTSADTAPPALPPVDSATVTIAAADLKVAGNYHFTATAGGAPAIVSPPSPAITQATTGDVPFSVVSGAVSSLKVAVQPINVIVGPTTTYNVQANSAIDSNSNPANGQTVILRVTDPAAVDTDSASLTIGALPSSGAGSGPGSGANATFNASAANVPYGNYSAKAIAGTVESVPQPFTVQPGLADSITGDTTTGGLTTFTAGDSFHISADGIKANGYAAKNGTTVSLLRAPGWGATSGFTTLVPDQTVANVNKGDDIATTDFVVTENLNHVAAKYTLRLVAINGPQTTVKGIRDVNIEIVAGNPVADLTVVAGDAAQYTDANVNVGNIPATVTDLEVTLTKPNNGGTILLTDTATPPSTTVTIPAADLNAGLGFYQLHVNGKNGLITEAAGNGSFQVVPALPDTIVTTVSSAIIPPYLGSETITATATSGGNAVAGRVLDITVSNALGQTALHTVRTTDALGKVSVSVFGTQTLAPGPYTVVVADLHTNPVVHGDASFIA